MLETERFQDDLRHTSSHPNSRGFVLTPWPLSCTLPKSLAPKEVPRIEVVEASACYTNRLVC